MSVPPWVAFSEFCLSLVRQQLQGTVCDQQVEVCSAVSWNHHFWEWLLPWGSSQGGCGQPGSWNPSGWGGATSFWAVAAILSGKRELGTALTGLLVPLNCGMLVVDPVTFSVPCLPVFLYLLHLPLCQNAAIAKKKRQKNFCFPTVSPFDNL